MDTIPPPNLLWEGKIQPHYPGISELEAFQRTPEPTGSQSCLVSTSPA